MARKYASKMCCHSVSSTNYLITSSTPRHQTVRQGMVSILASCRTKVDSTEHSTDLDLESRLIESERARNTPGARRNRRSTHASSRTKRNMHDPAAPPGKRRRSSTHERDVIKIDDDDYCDSEADLPDEWDGAESELQSIRYDQIYELFYGPNFMFIGQLACKDIGRAWIKMCHPRKQSQHPYNGGPTVARSLREHGYKGAYTKPNWWPADEGWRQGFGCRHIEPDHLKKLGQSNLHPDIRWR